MDVLKLRQNISKSASRYRSKDRIATQERQRKIKTLLVEKLMKSILHESNLVHRRLDGRKESSPQGFMNDSLK